MAGKLFPLYAACFSSPCSLPQETKENRVLQGGTRLALVSEEARSMTPHDQ
jgi:hypothetical protein